MPVELSLEPHIGVELPVRHFDRAIGVLAERQHGVVGRRQLIDLGMSRQAIGGRLQRGTLLRMHRGVYAVGRRGLTRHGEWMAAVLVGPPGTVLSHESAASLWGANGMKRDPIEVSGHRCRLRRSGIHGHQVELGVDEVSVNEGVPVTQPTRTLFDLAPGLRPRALEKVLNEFEARRLLSDVSLAELIARYPGRRGVRAIRQLLAVPALGITRSELEDRFIELLDESGVPRPRTNVDVALGGTFVEVDCIWRDARLVVELDGHAGHGSRQAFESDRERDRRLLMHGWRVFRVTWRQLHDSPQAIVNDLRFLLAARVGN